MKTTRESSVFSFQRSACRPVIPRQQTILRSWSGFLRFLALTWLAFATLETVKGEAEGPFPLGALADRALVRVEGGAVLGTRTRVSLAGEWLLQPVFPEEGESYDPATTKAAKLPLSFLPKPEWWLVTKVPGNWREKEITAKQPAGAPLLTVFDGPPENWPGAWLVKEVQLPALTPGQKVLVSLDMVWGGIYQDKAFAPSHVLVNGKYAGNLTGWQRRRIDATPFVRGDRLQIAILNGPAPGALMKGKKKEETDRALPAGIFKEPQLEITQPTSLFVDEVLVTPSFRNKTIKVAMTMQTDADGDAVFQAQLHEVPMFDQRKTWPPEPLAKMKPSDWMPDPASVAGKPPAFTLSAQAPVAVTKGRTEVSLTFPSGQLETWSLAHPRLYWLSLKVSDTTGKLLDTSVPVTFGFREIWVDGPDIMLNGMKINIYGTSHNYYGGYIWTPVDLAGKHQLGLVMDRTQSTRQNGFPWADKAPMLSDRWGHLFSVSPSDSTVGATLHRYLNNHPSFVMWQLSGNGFVNGPFAHPLQIGGTKIPKPGEPRYEEYAKKKEFVENIRKLDPTRLSFFYRVGLGGDIRAIMAYTDIGEPLMDMMEWPLAIYRNSKKRAMEPFMGAEIGFTISIYTLHCWAAPSARFGRLGHAEYGAQFLGDEAYALLTAEDMVPEAYFDPIGYFGKTLRVLPPLVVKLYEQLYRHVLPAWRTSGFNALLHVDGLPRVHFADVVKGELNEKGKEFRRVMGPLMAYIAGPGDDFNALDHAYQAGETLRKQLILFNDTFQAQPVKMQVTVKASLDGREIFTKQETVDVQNGRWRGVPIEFAVSQVAGKKKGVIQAHVTAGDQTLEVRDFIFQTFEKPVPSPVADAKIVLIDPVGDTAKMLEKGKFSFQRISPEQDPGDAALLILGRKLFADDQRPKLNEEAIKRVLGKGGSVIVFEQPARYVGGLIAEHFNIRYAFIRDRNHPLLAGLENEDFANWREAGDILAPYQDFEANKPYPSTYHWLKGGNWANTLPNKWGVFCIREADGRPCVDGDWGLLGVPNQWGQKRRFVPQWSNRNMVSTFCYKKPQTGRFRVLLDCGFDNLFTPLVEFETHGGRILFCQLDVANRYGTDPVITLLVNRMLEHYAKPVRQESRRMAAFGNEATDELVKKLKFQTVGRAEALDPVKHVVVVQPGAAASADLERVVQFVKKGGVCVVLGAFAEKDLAPLRSAGLVMFESVFDATDKIEFKDPPSLLAGVSASDFYYRRFLPGILVKEGAPGWTGAGGLVNVAPVGKGQVAYLAVRPELFGEETTINPNPKESWKATESNWPLSKYYRILSTLFANAGVGSETQISLLEEKSSETMYRVEALDFDPMQTRTW